MIRCGWWIVSVGVTVVFGATGRLPAQQNKAAPPDEKTARFLEWHPEADTDGDGVLSEEERAAFRDRRARSRLPERPAGEGPGRPDRRQLLRERPELDTNKDGVLDDNELRAAGPGVRRAIGDPFRPSPWFFDWLLEHFEAADLDRNGQLSREELEKLRAAHAPGLATRPSGDRPARPGQELLRRYPEADTDGDGMLSPEEYRALRKKQTDQMRQDWLRRDPAADTDGDGKLSEEEYRASRDKLRRERPGRPASP